MADEVGSLASSGHKSGRIDIADITANNIGQLRKLNAALFPVRFGERWYKDVLSPEVADICKFGLYNDLPVANVCCRFEDVDGGAESGGMLDVYIMTLGCLAPYRRKGISKQLLQHILSVAGPGKRVQRTSTAPDALQEKQKSSTGSGFANGKGNVDRKGTNKGADSTTSNIRCVYLHVQTGNDEARAFYESQGFKLARQVDEYYKLGITPRSAWVLEKR